MNLCQYTKLFNKTIKLVFITTQHFSQRSNCNMCVNCELAEDIIRADFILNLPRLTYVKRIFIAL